MLGKKKTGLIGKQMRGAQTDSIEKKKKNPRIQERKPRDARAMKDRRKENRLSIGQGNKNDWGIHRDRFLYNKGSFRRDHDPEVKRGQNYSSFEGACWQILVRGRNH